MVADEGIERLWRGRRTAEDLRLLEQRGFGPRVFLDECRLTSPGGCSNHGPWIDPHRLPREPRGVFPGQSCEAGREEMGDLGEPILVVAGSIEKLRAVPDERV